MKLKNLNAIPKAEYEKVVRTFNDTALAYPDSEATALTLFARQAEAHPDREALTACDGSLTFDELDKQSNAVANALIASGVRANDIVPVLLPRRTFLLSAILGILKSGGAYLPLDPEYPADRIARLVGDCGAKRLIAARGCETCPDGVEALYIEDLLGGDAARPQAKPAADDLFCALHTSGSTGVPKCTLLTHGNLADFVQRSRFAMEGVEHAVCTVIVTFDAFLMETIFPLSHGVHVALASETEIFDQALYERLVCRYENVFMFATPNKFKNYLLGSQTKDFVRSIRVILIGGEVVSAELCREIKAANPDLRLYDIYGPTETTIFVTGVEITDGDIASGDITIGRPEPNVQVYILDQRLKPVMVGVPGELCIAGTCVGRGYMNRPELTAEKFVPNPFGPGRMYRTGDIVKWRDDGKIEFIGRADNQVKIRGLRVELGEIEAAVTAVDGVLHAAVICHVIDGSQYLCAYYTGTAAQDAIRADIAQKLTQYMIPNLFIQMEAMPMTPSGKIDRKALPVPDRAAVQSVTEYIAPQNEKEQCLCEAFAKVLKIDRVGIDDSFFELGGDSLKAIALVNALRESRLRTSPKEVMALITPRRIAEQAALEAAEAAASSGEQGILAGDVPLHPIQMQFLDERHDCPDHFNQSVTFSVSDGEPLDPARTERALRRVLLRNDALRLKVAGRAQVYGSEAKFSFTVADADWTEDKLRRAAVELEKGHSLADGRLVGAMLYENGRKLFVTMHHWAVDGVSWGIFANAFGECYQEGLEDAAEDGYKKTVSVRQWNEALKDYAASLGEDTVRYWRDALRIAAEHPLPLSQAAELSPMEACASDSVVLDEQITARLLDAGYLFEGANAAELLLGIVALAYREATGGCYLPVVMEGHGREDWGVGLDVSRTMGWFTSCYPLALPTEDALLPQIRAVKRMWRNAPDRGLSFPALRYYTTRLESGLPRGMVFNYLGEVGASQQGLLTPCESGLGYQVSEKNRTMAPISFNAVLSEGKLQIAMSYDPALFEAAVAQRWLTGIGAQLAAADAYLQVCAGGYPVLEAQKGIYLACAAEPGSMKYNERSEYFVADADADKLAAAFCVAIRAYPAMRVSFREMQGEIFQFVDATEPEVPVRQMPETGLPEFRAKFSRPFDLDKGPLYHIEICQTERGVYVLQDIHHLVFDRTSAALLWANVGALYGGQSLRKERYSLFDAVCEEKYAKDTPEYMADRKFFLDRFRGLSAEASIPHSAAPGGDGMLLRGIGKETTSRLLRFGRRYGLTGNAVVLSALELCLAAYLGSDEVVLGTISSGRENTRYAESGGMFIKTVPLYGEIERGATALAFMRSVQESVQESLAHYRYSYAELVRETSAQRSGNAPIFDVLYIFENVGNEKATVGGMEAQAVAAPAKGAEKFALTVIIEPQEEEYGVAFDYDTSMYDEARMSQVMDVMVHYIETLLQDADALLKDFAPLPEAMYGQVVREFNQTGKEYPKAATVPDLFEEQARRNPDKTAVAACDGALSYGELNRLANGVARALQKAGVGPGDIVPMLLPRRGCLLAGLLGILKSGAAYLPIDPEYPAERIAYMVEDCGAQTALLGREYRLENFAGTVLYIEECLKPEEENPETKIASEDICYCIYTSGSTGKPKGTLLTHKNAVNYAKADAYGLGEKAKILSVTTVGFDIFGTESILPLVNGMQIVLANEEETVNAKACGKLVEKEKPDVIQTTPSKMRMLLGETEEEGDYLKHIKTVILGGEAVTGEIVKKIREKSEAAIYDSYGPTETTIWSTNEKLEGEEITIGRPIANTQIYIVNKNLKAQPVGAAGELCIAGDGVGKGYLNRPELTAEKFVENPFGEGKMYRTGDLAKWREDGKLEFIGRMDSQIKIRGLRVELGEIEAAVSAVSGVRQAAVICREIDGVQYLCAYYAGDVEAAAIRAEVAKRLAQYMVPHYFVNLVSLPLTGSGKIDRKALPLPEFAEMQTKEKYVAPQNDTERAFVAALENVLRRSPIGTRDNFFELGGDSMRAIQYAWALEKVGYKVGVKEIFSRPTVAELTQGVQSMKLSEQSARRYGFFTGDIPATSAQKRVYTAQLLAGGTAYNLPMALKTARPIARERLHDAFAKLIARHESLRTHFEQKSEEIVQVIAEQIEFAFDQAVKKDFLRPFDLGEAPLMRVALYEDEIWIDLHHIISDGATLPVIVGELDLLLRGETLPEVAQYQDFTYETLQYMRGENYQSDRAYWLEQFRAPLSDARIAPDQAVLGRDGAAYVESALDAALTECIFRKANRLQITPYAYFMAAFGIVMARYTASEDIVVGTVSSGRASSNLQMIGMLVNTIAVRINAATEPTSDAYIRRVSQILGDAMQHQRYPFEDLIGALGLKYDGERNPLFDVMFIYQPESGELRLDGAPAWQTAVDGVLSGAKFDLTFNAVKQGEAMRFVVEYRRGIYKETTMRRLLECYKTALASLLQDQTLEAVDILSERERNRVVRDFNATQRPFPRDTSVAALFAARAKKSPHKTAVVACDGEYSYQRVNAMANGAALALRAHGIGRGDIVPMILPRRGALLSVLLGILKSGAAYLPIDPEYPRERILYMLEDCGAKALIVARGYEVDGFGGSVLYAEDILSETETEPDTAVSGDDLCYCIYTSGSTGLPKGTLLTHRNVVNYAFADAYGIGETARVLSVTTIGFDIFGTESILPLLHGMTIVLADEEQSVDAEKCAALTEAERPDVIQTTPTKMRLLMGEKPEGAAYLRHFKTVILGGESVPKELVEAIGGYTDAAIFDSYGPTETTIWSTNAAVLENDITIGKPIANTQIYILDARLRPQPIGVAGELCIAGDGVGKGYLHRPELTAEKFVDHPFGEGKMYRTGDLAKWREDGNLDFIGRMDHQVKIRGLRVELGEIEAAIAAVEGVRQAAVVCIAAEDAQYLCAYYTGDAEPAAIRGAIGKTLPQYMAPHVFEQMAEMPMTASGKIDRKALPAPDLSKLRAGAPYRAPETDAQRIFVPILEEILKVALIGIDDNFFERGGDSLKAIRYSSKLLAAGYRVGVKDIFTLPTVALLAANAVFVKPEVAVNAVRPAAAAFTADDFTAKDLTPAQIDRIVTLYGLNIQDVYELSPGQMWMFGKASFVTAAFFTQALFQVTGPFDTAAFRKNLDAVVERYDNFRTAFAYKGFVKPYQVVLKHRPAELSLRDLTHIAADERDDALQSIMAADRRRGFDLQEDVLLRVSILRLDAESTAILVSQPHISIDGVSMTLFYRELFADAADWQAATPDVQYKDYIAWLGEIDREAQLAYWRQELSGLSACTATPGRIESRLDYEQATAALTLDQETTKLLGELAGRAHTTLFNALQTIWGVMLASIYDMGEATFGAISSGRPDRMQSAHRIMGGMVNAMPVRVRTGSASVRQILDDVHARSVESLDHSFCSPDEIAAAIGRTEQLFDHLLNSHLMEGGFDDETAQTETGSVSLKGLRSFDYLSTDLCVYFSLQKKCLTADFVYNKNVLSPLKIALLQKNFERAATQIAHNPDIAPRALQVDKLESFEKATLDEREKRRRIFAVLKGFAIFAGCGEAALGELAEQAEVGQYAMDDCISKNQKEARRVAFIAKGFAEYAREAADGWLVSARILKEGDLVAVEGILGGRTQSEVAAASEDVVTLEFPPEVFRIFMAREPRFGMNLLRELQRRVCATEKLWIVSDQAR